MDATRGPTSGLESFVAKAATSEAIATMTDFYKGLRVRIRRWARSKSGRKHKWAEYVLLAPDFFHLLVKLVADRRVSWKTKALLGGSIAYFVSPFDIFPEAVFGPPGYLDDVALAALAIQHTVKTAGPNVVRSHWAGEGDVLQQVRRVLDVVEEMIGPSRWKRILELFKSLGGRAASRRRRRKSEGPRGGKSARSRAQSKG